MAVFPDTLKIYSDKTKATLLWTYTPDWAGSSGISITSIASTIWISIPQNADWFYNTLTNTILWLDDLMVFPMAGSNFDWYFTYSETITSFYLDWQKYKIWWDEAAWWNISWTLSDQTDLQNALNSKQNTLTAWENIKIASNVISANNVFIITEDDVTVSTDDTKWVAPYNTSYGYTNIDISANAGIEWREWAIYTFVVDTKMVVASAYRNVRVKIWTWNYIPVMSTTAALSWSSYFTKTNTRQYQYSTKYESWW